MGKLRRRPASQSFSAILLSAIKVAGVHWRCGDFHSTFARLLPDLRETYNSPAYSLAKPRLHNSARFGFLHLGKRKNAADWLKLLSDLQNIAHIMAISP
jgi:hypothetical protein